ncbi:IS66 family transposase [Sutterella wadsworthensis]|uniref:IS66 family transposase n=2 Tax=Sutterella wadsworthensis TaxID=40545 RepID=UPI003080F46D
MAVALDSANINLKLFKSFFPLIPPRHEIPHTPRKADPYAAACIYYMNGRQKFRTFLLDPRIPPSTDIVEGRIRPVTVLRKNIYFMQTLRGAEAMLAAYSLVQTGKLNGMDVRT